MSKLSKKKSLLIVGVDSEIGSFLYSHPLFKKMFNIYGTTRKKKIKKNKNMFYLDLGKYNPKYFINVKFDYVVFCAGISKISFCEKNYNLAKKINVKNTYSIISDFQKKNSYVLYISSASVFDGSRRFFKINDDTNPVNNYGRLKKEIEEKLLKKENISILRLTKVISKKTPIILKWSKNIENKKKIFAYENKFLSPVSIFKVLKSIILILSYKKSGIFHLGSNYEISYANFAKKYFKKNVDALKFLEIRKKKGSDVMQHNSLKTHLPGK